MNPFSSTLAPPSFFEMDELMSQLEKGMEEFLLSNADDESSAGQSVAAALYHLRSGGRRIRARLALHASLSLGLSSLDALVLASTVELLHNASLVHDDLQDDELLRHERPTVGVVYGTNIAICTGDLLVSAAYASLATFSKTKLLAKLIGLVHTATAEAIRGQCAGFPHSESAPNDLVRYNEVAIAKSGALLSLPLQLAFLGAGKRHWLPQARRAAEEFALGYQIMDDLQDVVSDGPMAMNMVTVLKACGHGEHAHAQAYERGLQHLRNAADLSDELPDGSGDLLKALAYSLSRRPSTE
jgi:geranylgeranyl pyrophosphate synthase